MSSDERDAVNQFMAAISYVQTGPDGFPSWAHQALEIDGLCEVALQVGLFAATWDLDCDEQKRTLAQATAELCCAVDPRMPDWNSTDPRIPEEYFRARAALIWPADG